MSEAVEPAGAMPMSAGWRWAFAPLRFLACMVATQNALFAVFLLGYLYRRMQNHAIAVWTGRPFQTPRWLLSERPDTNAVGRFSGALWQHLKTGLGAWLLLAVFALPSGALIAVSWYAGWNNSFYKGYEYATVGPLLGVFGILVGMVTLTYLPYAQARHAATGDWRTLFRWRQNLTLISMRPFANLALPIIYAITGLCVAGARGLLTFAPQVPAFAGLEQDPQGFMGSWFFWWAVPFIVLLLLAKRFGARGYAKAVLAALDKKVIGHGELHDAERYYVRDGREVVIAETSRSTGKLMLNALCPALLWFPFFAFLYVQQFVNYVGAWGWLNHPVLWLPVLAYSP